MFVSAGGRPETKRRAPNPLLSVLPVQNDVAGEAKGRPRTADAVLRFAASDRPIFFLGE